MKLIVGLGNVGKEYAHTRHNLGFMVLDKLVELQDWPNFEVSSKFKALVCQVSAADKLILAKPTTMMNLSGQAVGELVRFFKLDTADVWVIYDEADLEFGQLRTKLGGGSAGHNGIKSITEAIGPDFGRFRVGIKNELKDPTPTDQFVLSRFTDDEQALLPQVLSGATSVILNHLKTADLPAQTFNLLNQ